MVKSENFIKILEEVDIEFLSQLGEDNAKKILQLLRIMITLIVSMYTHHRIEFTDNRRIKFLAHKMKRKKYKRRIE